MRRQTCSTSQTHNFDRKQPANGLMSVALLCSQQPARSSAKLCSRTLQNLSKAVRQADMALLYDTGSRVGNDINPPVRIAACQRLTTKILVKSLPEWARIVLGGAEIQR
jgi:hypothetical protein